MFSSLDYNTILKGGDVLVAGLALQLASITSFCIWMARSDYQIIRYSEKLAADYEKEWSRIRIARWISIAGILVYLPSIASDPQVRAIYRVLEYAQGQYGFLLLHEVYLPLANYLT